MHMRHGRTYALLTTKIQKVPGQVPLTMAGPKLRAGLMEQPASGGMDIGGRRGLWWWRGHGMAWHGMGMAQHSTAQQAAACLTING